MRTELIVLVVVLSLFVGCSSGPVCDKPYILVGGSCCLDNNSNGVCDKDEVPAAPKGADLEAGWRVCESDLNRKSADLSDFYSQEVSGSSASYRESLGIFVRYSQRFDEFSAVLSSCRLFLESNKEALIAAGHDPAALLGSMNNTYSSQKTFLDAWAVNLKAVCPNGFVLGADDSCHEMCAGGFCQPGTVCCNNRCQPLCGAGSYMATDCKCHPN